MNGATADPCVNTMRLPSSTNTSATPTPSPRHSPSRPRLVPARARAGRRASGFYTQHIAQNKDKMIESFLMAARALIEKRLTEWIFGEKGLLSQWRASWLNFQIVGYPADWDNSELTMSRLGLRPGWELAKSNGILHGLSYYLNHVKDDPRLREKVELGLRYLSNPLKARMSGVCSDPDESYGEFAGQATGFAGLSLAEADLP